MKIMQLTDLHFLLIKTLLNSVTYHSVEKIIAHIHTHEKDYDAIKP